MYNSFFLQYVTPISMVYNMVIIYGYNLSKKLTVQSTQIMCVFLQRSGTFFLSIGLPIEKITQIKDEVRAI